MALNLLGGKQREVVVAPVTLPRVSLPEPDDQTIAEEAAAAIAHVSQQRTIRLGRDAWQAVQKSQSFPAWVAVGMALQIGRAIAERATGATTGKHYSRTFYEWADRRGFTGMTKEARWSAVDLVENIKAVEAWRSTLSEKDRRRLVHPLSNVRRWRESMTPKAEPCAVAKAEAALRHFVTCMKALTPEQAAPLWRAVQAQAQESLT